MHSRSGLRVSTSSLAPPTRKVSVASSAGCLVPATGASTKRRPCSPARAAIARLNEGLTVEQSTHSAPWRIAGTKPSSPNATASTTLGSASMVKTMSASATASAAELAAWAPASASASAGSGERLKTLSVTSSWRIRLRAMRRPMIPRPIKVTFITLLPVDWRHPKSRCPESVGLTLLAKVAAIQLGSTSKRPSGRVPTFPDSLHDFRN